MVFQTHGNAMKLIDIHATLKSEISLDIVPIQCGFYFNIYNEDTEICQDLMFSTGSSIKELVYFFQRSYNSIQMKLNASGISESDFPSGESEK